MIRAKGFWPLVLVLMLAESVSALEITMIYAAMRGLIDDFGSPTAVGWLLTGFMLSAAAAAALCGRLGDLLGRKRILLWVIAVATIGSIISGLSSSLGWIIAGRALQGVSGAILPLCFGLVRELAPQPRVALGIGLVGATATLCAGAGFILGGVVVDLLDWSAIFHICAALGVAAFVMVFLVLPVSAVRKSAGPLDLLGGLLFAPAILSMLLALVYGKTWGWTSLQTLGLLGAGTALMAAWVFWELRITRPLLDVRLFGVREIAVSNLVFALTAIGVMQGGQIMSLLAQQSPAVSGAGLGLSATVAGLLLFPGNIVGSFTSPWVGRLIARFTARAVMSAGAALMTASWILLALLHQQLAWVVGFLIVQSIGLSLVYITVPVVLVAAAPSDRTSEATGISAVVRATAMAVGAQCVAALLASSTVTDGATGGAFPDGAAIRTTMVFVAGCSFLALIAARLLPSRDARELTTVAANQSPS